MTRPHKLVRGYGRITNSARKEFSLLGCSSELLQISRTFKYNKAAAGLDRNVHKGLLFLFKISQSGKRYLFNWKWIDGPSLNDLNDFQDSLNEIHRKHLQYNLIAGNLQQILASALPEWLERFTEDDESEHSMASIARSILKSCELQETDGLKMTFRKPINVGTFMANSFFKDRLFTKNGDLKARMLASFAGKFAEKFDEKDGNSLEFFTALVNHSLQTYFGKIPKGDDWMKTIDNSIIQYLKACYRIFTEINKHGILDIKACPIFTVALALKNPKCDEDLNLRNSIQDMLDDIQEATGLFISDLMAGAFDLEIPISVDEPEEASVRVENKDEFIEGIFFTDYQYAVFDSALKTVNKKGKNVIMLVGPPGYGKTSLPKAFGIHKGMKTLVNNCSVITEATEWFGVPSILDGKPVLIKSKFLKTVEEGNAVIVLDEANRLDPFLMNPMFSLLDGIGETEIFGHEVKVGPNILWVMTANIGAQFVSTHQVDMALSNRIKGFMTVGAIPPAIETKLLVKESGISAKDSGSIVSIANKIRSKFSSDEMALIDCPTRTTLAIAEWVASGLSVPESFRIAMITPFNTHAHKDLMEIING